MIGIVCLVVAVAVSSALLTGILRRYALARSLVDIPNARSSHTVPTPRGGGAAIVLSFALAVPAVIEIGGGRWADVGAILGAGGLAAGIGILDDRGHIAARWRLVVHFFAATWAVAGLAAVPAIAWFGAEVDLDWLGPGLAALYLVWCLNLYNFMDGIDGIASVEAIFVCVGGALLFWLNGRPELSVVAVTLAAAVTGFLFWNFPPAKMFMGDAGSGFLGIVIGTMSLQAGLVSPALLWSWLILLGVFVVDATWTLLRRSFRGERVYEAHRSHAYQHAALRFGRHLPVTLGVCAINLFWLLPLAVLVATQHIDGVFGIAVAYFPLLVVAVALNAGGVDV